MNSNETSSVVQLTFRKGCVHFIKEKGNYYLRLGFQPLKEKTDMHVYIYGFNFYWQDIQSFGSYWFGLKLECFPK